MTKWTKKALVILLSIAVIACMFALTACAHEHEWASEWSKDDTNHWHECLDEECQEKGDLAAHTWNAGEITTPATEDATGVKTFTCTECSQTKTEVVAKLDHTHVWATELSKDATGHWYACTKAGCDGKNGFEAHSYPATYQKDDNQHWKVCSDCGWEDTKADHIWDEGTVTTPPTGTSAGEKSVTCGICGKTATQDIPKLEQYTISFDADGGLPAPSSITVTFGDTIDASKLPVPEKEGYDLVGWYAQDSEGAYTVKLGVDMTTVGDLGDDGDEFTVKALWEIHRWTVSFNAGDGVEVADQLVTHGKCAEFVEPNKEGAIFLRWELNGAEYDFATPITEDVELTAVYQEWTVEAYGSTSFVTLVGQTDDAEALGGKSYKATLSPDTATDNKGIKISFGEQGIDISNYAHVFIRVRIINPVNKTNCTLRISANQEPTSTMQGYPYYDPVEKFSSDIWRHYFSYDIKDMTSDSVLKTLYIARTNTITAGDGAQIEIYIDHIDFVQDALVLENVTSVKNDITGNSTTNISSNKNVIQTLGASNMNDKRAAFVGWDLDIYTGKYAFIGNFRQATNDVLAEGKESDRSLTLNFNNIDLTQYEHVYIKIKSLNTDTDYPANCNVFLGINGYSVTKNTPEKDWTTNDVTSGAMYNGYFIYDILAIENCPDVLTSLSIYRLGAVSGYQYGIMFYIESIEFVVKADHTHASETWLFNADYTEQYKVCVHCGEIFGSEEHQHSNSTPATCLAKAVCGVCNQEHGELADHSFGEVSYVWTADYSKCTATRVCSRDESHLETETVDSVKNVTQESTTEQDELSTFTATFTNSAFAEQVQENIVTGSAQVLNYTIKFDTDGGTEVADAQVKFGDAISEDGLPTTTKAGYTFLGWYAQDGDGEYTLKLGVDLKTIPNLGADGAEYTVKAKWEINSYTVSFNVDGATAIDNQEIEYGQTVTQPDDPYKEGAIFIGWEIVDGEEYDFATPIEDDTEIVAKYEIWTIEQYLPSGSTGVVALSDGTVDDAEAYGGKAYKATLTGSATDTKGIKISFGDGIDISQYAHVFVRVKIVNTVNITNCTLRAGVNAEPVANSQGYPYYDPAADNSSDIWRHYFSYDLKELLASSENGILKSFYLARTAQAITAGGQIEIYIDHIDFVKDALVLDNVSSITNSVQGKTYTVTEDTPYSQSSIIKLNNQNVSRAAFVGWDLDIYTGKYAFIGNFRQSINDVLSAGSESSRMLTLNFDSIDLTQYSKVIIKIKNYNTDPDYPANCTVAMGINGTTVSKNIPTDDWTKEDITSGTMYTGYFEYDLIELFPDVTTLSSISLYRLGAVNGYQYGIMMYIESIEFVPV